MSAMHAHDARQPRAVRAPRHAPHARAAHPRVPRRQRSHPRVRRRRPDVPPEPSRVGRVRPRGCRSRGRSGVSADPRRGRPGGGHGDGPVLWRRAPVCPAQFCRGASAGASDHPWAATRPLDPVHGPDGPADAAPALAGRGPARQPCAGGPAVPCGRDTCLWGSQGTRPAGAAAAGGRWPRGSEGLDDAPRDPPPRPCPSLAGLAEDVGDPAGVAAGHGGDPDRVSTPPGRATPRTPPCTRPIMPGRGPKARWTRPKR